MLLFLAKVAAVAQILASCTARVPGPQNITRTEGDNDIPIDCQFSAPIWSINSTLYEPLSLKLPLKPTSIGITITVLEKSYDHISFQCFSSNGTGLFVLSSEIGILTVQASDSNVSPPPAEYIGQIILDHRRFHFNTTNKTISWKFDNNQSYSSSLIYTVKSLTCDTNDPVKNWTTPDSELTLPSSAFALDDKLLCFTIEANDGSRECPQTSLHFQIHPEVLPQEVSVTLGDNGCLEVPEIPEHQNLYIVWPSDKGTDCICPLCDNGNCVLSNCECYKKNMTFVPELQSNYSKYTLCWSNLLTDRNNSYIYFFFEAQTHNMFLFRIYDSVYNLVIRSPPLAPILTIKWSEICFSSYSYYPIDYYVVEIIDFTGDEIHTQIKTSNLLQNTSDSCIIVSGDYFLADCYPYSVFVRAHSKVGLSTASNVTLPESGEIDSCSCMQQKTSVDVKILKKTKSSVQLQINCTTLLIQNSSKIILKLTANKQSENYTVTTVNLECPIYKKLDLHNLNPNTKYTVIAEYPLRLGSVECKLRIQTFTAQPVGYTTTIIISTITAGLVCALIALAVLAMVAYTSYKKHWKKGKKYVNLSDSDQSDSDLDESTTSRLNPVTQNIPHTF